MAKNTRNVTMPRRQFLAPISSGGSSLGSSSSIVSGASTSGSHNALITNPSTIYVAKGVHLNGETYLSSEGLTASNSGDLTYSFWFKLENIDSNTSYVWVEDPLGVYLSSDSFEQGTGKFFSAVQGGINSSLGTTGGTDISFNTWHHIIVAMRANASQGNKTMQVYVDDVAYSFTKVDSNAGFQIAFNGMLVYFFADTYGDAFTGEISDFWWAPGQYIDISVLSNRRKFIGADRKPVNLGGDGSIPTTVAPAVFFSGDSTQFSTNRGTGGDFVLTGSLTNSLTSPGT